MTTLPQQSLAAVTTGPNVMEIRRLEIPDIGDDEAIVRIEATGICGTDYEWFRGDLDIPYPIILGHEPLGRIAAIGSQASERWGVGIGDRVAVRSGYRCGRCAACEAGGTEPCPTAGGFGQTGLDKSPCLWGSYDGLSPDDLTWKKATMRGVLGVEYSAFRRAVDTIHSRKYPMDYKVMSTCATDYPPGPFEPLMGIQSCVTRTDSEGREWGMNQRISVEDALRVYTLNGADAGFEEGLKGSIEVGKLADLVVLGADPTAIDPFGIRDIPVERTIVCGRTVYEG